MEEKRPSSDYASGPPWLFKGSALYQFHLVKAETARALIPKEFKLVEAFGYTLGGLFLADYEDSPAGKFDELVVIAGIVWNPPTSCAWAARVLVNSPEACRHGQKEVGLPSHVGIFSKRAVEIKQPINKCSSLLNMIGIGSNQCGLKEHTEIQISETKASSLMSLCSISFPCDMPNLKTGKKWMGPMIKMSLPSFSGRTIHNPHLLKYSCQIQCRVRPVGAAKISGPTRIDPSSYGDDNPSTNVSEEDNAWNHSISVLLSKPILALEFNLLKMQVEAPTVLCPQSKRGDIGDARAC